MKNGFKTYLSNYVILTNEEFDFFYNLFHIDTYHKKESILKNNPQNNTFLYVAKGIVKVFSIDKKGNEHILFFADEQSWVINFKNNKRNENSNLFLQSLEDNTLFSLSEENKKVALRKIPKLEVLFCDLYITNYNRIQDHLIEMLTYTAKSRYKRFVSKNPKKSQRLTNIQIAAYLGITHEFVSKIRKD